MITMTNMIEAVTKKRQFEQRLDRTAVIHLISDTFDVAGVGKVRCELHLVQAVHCAVKPHLRKVWELNDTKISAAKLASLIPA